MYVCLILARCEARASADGAGDWRTLDLGLRLLCLCLLLRKSKCYRDWEIHSDVNVDVVEWE